MTNLRSNLAIRTPRRHSFLKVFCKHLHMVSFIASMVWLAGHVRRYSPKILTWCIEMHIPHFVFFPSSNISSFGSLQVHHLPISAAKRAEDLESHLKKPARAWRVAVVLTSDPCRSFHHSYVVVDPRSRRRPKYTAGISSGVKDAPA